MDKKRLITGIIIIITIGLVISGIVVLINGNRKSIKYIDYAKYSLSISIDLKTENGIDPIMIEINDDGKSASLTSNKVNKESYIIGKKLYYLDGDTFYLYETPISYRDIYKIIKSYKISDKIKSDERYAYYSTLLSEREINDLLDALFIGKDTKSKSAANIIFDENRLSEFKITISDIEGYDEINILIKYEELDSDYSVDTSKIYGSSTGVSNIVTYKRVQTHTNVYGIVK